MSGSGVVMTTQGSDDVNGCMETRYWFHFLASSLIVFFAGVVAIFLWRIVEHLFGCGWTAAMSGRTQADHGDSRTASIAARIKWKCEKLVSGQTFVGRITVSLSCLLSIGSFIIYLYDVSERNILVETCIPWAENTSQIVDFAFNMYFLLAFIIRLIAANDKLVCWVDINSIVDYCTIPPAFVGLALGRQWIGLRFLRAIRLMSIPDILQYMNVLRTSNSIRFMQLVTIFLSVWLAATGFIHIAEVSGDPWADFTNFQEDLSYWDFAYFAIVTMSTVGYGDIGCKTVLGRIFIIIFIFGALAMFASFIPAIADILGKRQRYGGFYESTVGIRHIVICGHITFESVQNFLRDFLHEDRLKNNVKCVFLENKRPELELEALFKRNFTKVEFFKGSIMNTRDIERVKLLDADACLIMANPHAVDQDSEDASNIMRVISVKNSCADKPVIVQLIRFNNKTFCVNLPSWSATDQVICLSEMKLGFMASGCLAPGFSTLLANLFVMRSYKQSSKFLKWQDEYLEGAGMEVYAEKFSSAFYGLAFPAVAEKCFVKLQLLLVAVAAPSRSSQQAARVILNPSGAGSKSSAAIIDADMKGFFICQSQDDAKRVLYYCDSCHSNVNDVSKINRCTCADKGRDGGRAVDETHVTLELNDNIPLSLAPAARDGDRQRPEAGEEETPSSDGAVTEQFESTGLFHWCDNRTFESAVLSHERNRDVLKHLKDHVIVSCFSDGVKSPLLGLCNFIMPLRASNLRLGQLRTVVVLADEEFLRKEWPTICNFPDIYVKTGSPLNRSNLRVIRVNRCHMCVILTTNESSIDDPTLIDKESILCSLNIKTMSFHPGAADHPQQPASSQADVDVSGRQSKRHTTVRRVTAGNYIPMLTELANDYNAQFLDQDDEDDPDVPLYMTQPFACGRAFAASVLDSLMSTTFFYPELLSLIRALVVGGDAHELELILAEGVGLLKTPSGDIWTNDNLVESRDRCHVTLLGSDDVHLAPFFDENYGKLVINALKCSGILCLGLYRRMYPDESYSNPNRYVITNPSAALPLLPSDQVYCLKPFSASGECAETCI